MGGISEYLKAQGYGEVDGRIYGYIELWKSWYAGKVRSFHCYRQYNGRERIARERKSLGMAKCVAEDWANLLLNERVTISAGNESLNAIIHDVLSDNRFGCRANQLIELTFALGTGAFVEFTDGGEIVIDYIRADMIFPLTEINGRITECAFASKRRVGEKELVYLNIHTLDGRGCYIVENLMFEQSGENGALRPIALPEGMQERVETGSPVPLFQIIRPNIVNNIVLGSPMGVSVYANAIDQLEGVDLVYDSYCNEFRLGKKRLIVPMSFAQIEMEQDGVTLPVFDSNDTEFFAVNLGGDGGGKIQEINMELRSEAHETALKTALNALSLKCGMGTGRYRFEEQSVKTATEVISAKSELYQNVRKHEILLGDAIEGVCRAVASLLGLGQGFSVDISFDDSIIEDTAAERTRDIQEVRDGLMAKWEYRVKWRGEDEATAKKMVAREAFVPIEI